MYISYPRKLCFIDLELTRGLVTPNVFTRDCERMIIFGHYRRICTSTIMRGVFEGRKFSF